MEQYFLIWALILIIGTLMFYVIMKSLLKTLATFLFIIVLFVVITGTLTYSDFNNLRTKLEKMETAYIFEDNNESVFGMVATESTQTELDITQSYKKIYDNNEYYRIIVIKFEAYNELPEEIASRSKAEWFNIIEDESASFTERAQAFSVLNSALKEQGISKMFHEYKQGEIIVYPRTMFFRIISTIPESWINTFIPSSNEE